MERGLTDFLVGVGKTQHMGSGSSALEASRGARTFWLCVAPLRIGGLRGKKSTPSVWLGGTGELIEVGKQEQERQEQGILRQANRPRYDPELSS